MVGPNDPYIVHLLRHARRRDWTGKRPRSSEHHCCRTPSSQAFSPAKTIFTGIGILLGVCFPPSSLSAVSHDIDLLGCERCCGEPCCSYPPLRASPLIPATSEMLHCDAIDERIDGVAWENYGAVTFDSCTFDKGDDGQEDQCVDSMTMHFL
jgi:hypothetical protein